MLDAYCPVAFAPHLKMFAAVGIYALHRNVTITSVLGCMRRAIQGCPERPVMEQLRPLFVSVRIDFDCLYGLRMTCE
jgi:hypothetical protein